MNLYGLLHTKKAMHCKSLNNISFADEFSNIILIWFANNCTANFIGVFYLLASILCCTHMYTNIFMFYSANTSIFRFHAVKTMYCLQSFIINMLCFNIVFTSDTICVQSHQNYALVGSLHVPYLKLLFMFLFMSPVQGTQ